MGVSFTVGQDFDVIAELTAWADRDAAGERETALALARLTVVSKHGIGEARADVWSPPDLFMFNAGRLSVIYAARTRRGGANVLVLYACDMRRAKSAASFEAEAKRRLEATESWE